MSAATFSESGDAGAARATAGVPGVAALTEITGSVSPASDRDLYKICLSGGQFTAPTNTSSDPILGLFDESGALVAENDSFSAAFGDDARIDAAVAAGAYYLAITSYSSFSADADTARWLNPNWRAAGAGQGGCRAPHGSEGPYW